ncbi:hypothetical protein [Rudaea sp.]|uniref:hypothetical protein n=1 Tax=Rudaea sp. TaxID=2136325 RepID=UPI002ECFBEBC
MPRLRVTVWIAILALALGGTLLHNDSLSAAIAPLVLAYLLVVSPRMLRLAIATIAVVEAAAWWVGGTRLMVDLLPVAIAAFVGWLFARSLMPPRRPLIACAIAAIDGAARLDDIAVARYARRLTVLWAVFQMFLAAFGLLCVLHDRGVIAVPMPSPHVYDLLLPLAVAMLFFGEFLLRPRLLPQVPRHALVGFLRALARVWPELIEN